MNRHKSYQDTSERDQYGGWTGKKFEATGFFRVEKDERWWLVTPEGNAFLSFGINHLHPHLWKQDYNREAWQKALGHRQSVQPRIHTRPQNLVPANMSSIRLQHSRRTHRVISSQSPAAIYAIYAVDSLCRYPALAARNTRQQFSGCLFRRICLTLRSDGKGVCRACKR